MLSAGRLFERTDEFMKTIVVFAGAGAIALVGAAYAQMVMGPGKGMMKGDPAMMENHFAQMDADANGVVTHDEFIALQMQIAEQRWAMFSSHAGDDGAVSLDEAKAHHADMTQQGGMGTGMGPGMGMRGDCPMAPAPADESEENDAG